MDVIGHEPKVRLRVPVQADGHVPLRTATEVPVVEVDGAEAGGDLEDADAAAGDALVLPHFDALEGRVGRSALGRQRIGAAFPVQRHRRLDVAALEAEPRQAPELLHVGPDVLGLHQEGSVAVGEFGPKPRYARHAGKVAGVDEGAPEQESLRPA